MMMMMMMSRERLTLGPCATVNQQQLWMCMANHMLSRHNYYIVLRSKLDMLYMEFMSV